MSRLIFESKKISKLCNESNILYFYIVNIKKLYYSHFYINYFENSLITRLFMTNNYKIKSFFIMYTLFRPSILFHNKNIKTSILIFTYSRT